MVHTNFDQHVGARNWRLVVRTVCLTWIAVLFSLLILGFATKVSAIYSRRVFLTYIGICPFFMISSRVLMRMFLREMRASGRNTRTVAIAGAGKLGISLAHALNDTPSWGLRLTGFFDDHKPINHRPSESVEAKVQGTLETLVDCAKDKAVDLVFIALPMRAEEPIKKLVSTLADTTASVYIVPDLFIFDLLQARWDSIGTLPVFGIHETPFNGVGGWCKRIEDIILASVILTLIALPMLVIAIGVKLTSPGPVLFKQRRYGLDGREIIVWKFRTMTVCEDGDEIRQAGKNDARITPFGAFLRHTSLDEFPQFINVFTGHMSIVGPRPHAVAHNEEYRKQISGYMLRHKVKPGITGWAQVNGWRGETDTLDKMENRIRHDLDYIRNWSLWLDLRIVFLTMFRGFWGKNAY